jgi:hypothetical protein
MLSPDILQRALISFQIFLFGMSLYLLFDSNLRYEFLARRLLADLGSIYRGTYVLIYFSNPTSAVCNTVQRPAIEKLRDLLGSSLQVLEVDITKEPELTHRWKVPSVPATYLINPRGELHHVNYGLAQAEELLLQMFIG